ncbi:C40 family peptidase [Fulvivirga maritima]|uniref:C40 family peptidase n=1 Tax=Fulvivirga maritima TaxID=2904247 RepID=UPI001F45DE48|nr:C40 family peptidase [Fulvivirga maritima]UII25667.1 C40 family peptidase [Fulvivirga maritima]
MKRILPFLLIFYACSFSKKNADNIVYKVGQYFAPDKRVVLYDLTYNNGILKGETSSFLAYQALKDSLGRLDIDYIDSVQVLPIDTNKHAVVSLSVANLRSEGRHSSELVTQALCGTPLLVLKQEGGWLLVQTPDAYIAWVDEGGVTIKNADEMNAWERSEKLIFTNTTGYLFKDSTYSETVSDLVAGDILKLTKKGADFSHAKMPDGRAGVVLNDQVDLVSNWSKEREVNDAELKEVAFSMMGVPYLWGGTSVKGVDCSGFTKTIYFMNGYIIPRDASQQVNEGQLIDEDKNWENLQTGDLLFFGREATDQNPEKVVHVGMWIGDDRFIHSSGKVHISSVNPQDSLYDEYNVNRYLRTKRIIKSHTDGIKPLASMLEHR